MSPTPDFVDVQLSATGKQAAGDGPLRIANAHFHYEFLAGKPVRVLLSEWRTILSQVAEKDNALLEIAPPPAPTITSVKQKAAQPEEPGA